MANNNTAIFVLTLLLSSLLTTLTKTQEFSTSLSKEHLCLQNQKLTHLHFYFHDIVSGRNPTAVRIASAATTDTSATAFGFLAMLDDPLTMGPEPDSKIVGRAQGVYGSADLNTSALLMVLNYYFSEGEFNGSTLSVLGRNAIMDEVREMPIVGGSGVFRFAQGYADAKTYIFDLETGDAVVEYNVYVLHY